MPRNVRNFWVEADVDGKATPVAFGPRAKDGGFTLVVKMRDEGGIITPLRVDGYARADGTLVLMVYNDASTKAVVHGGGFRVVTRR